jgi:hypothetical protein
MIRRCAMLSVQCEQLEAKGAGGAEIDLDLALSRPGVAYRAEVMIGFCSPFLLFCVPLPIQAVFAPDCIVHAIDQMNPTISRAIAILTTLAMLPRALSRR